MSTHARCSNCSLVMNMARIRFNENPWSIPDLSTRVAPGEAFPCGECPHCGALCVPHDASAISESEVKLKYYRVRMQASAVASGEIEVLAASERGAREEAERQVHNAFWTYEGADLNRVEILGIEDLNDDTE